MKKSIAFVCTFLVLLLILPVVPAFADEELPEPIVISASENLYSGVTVANCKKTLVTDGEFPYISLTAKGRTGDPYITISLTKYYKKASIDKIQCDGVKYILIKARAVSGIEGDMTQIYYSCQGGGISEQHSVQSTGSFKNDWEYYVFNMTNASDFTGALNEIRYDFINLMDANGEFHIAEMVFCYDLTQVYKLCGLNENGGKPKETQPETTAEETSAVETQTDAAEQTNAKSADVQTQTPETTAGTSDGCKSAVGVPFLLLPLILSVLYCRKEDENQ